MEHNPLCVVKYRHFNGSFASKGHAVKVGGEGEVIVERSYAVRQSEFGPWKQFSVCGIRVDWLQGCGLIWLRTTSL